MTTTSTPPPLAQPRLRSWPPDAGTLQCPWPLFEELRELAPVFHCPEPGPDGTRPFVVTGFPEVQQALVDHHTFASDLTGVLPSHGANMLPAVAPEERTFYQDSHLFFSDGEDHTVKRSWAYMVGERARLAGFRPVIQEVVDALIDDFIDRGECDFRAEFTMKMPLALVRRMMDLPPEVDPLVKAVSAGIESSENNPNLTQADIDAFGQTVLGLLSLLAGVIRERHVAPKDDYVSQIVAMQVARDGELDVNALSRNLAMTIFGADHAMGGHLADVVARLGSDADLQDRVRDDRDLIRSLHLETLRLDIPVPWIFRHCVSDTTLGGVAIPAGSLVLLVLASGNRDPQEFPLAEAFDVDRDNLDRSVMTFGRGAHRCVGMPVARIITEVTVNRLLDRLRDIRVDTAKSNLEPEPSFVFRIAPAVHLTFSKA
ncbi:MAG: cytochrome P450 [Nocardioidaceae bacterium]